MVKSSRPVLQFSHSIKKMFQGSLCWGEKQNKFDECFVDEWLFTTVASGFPNLEQSS